MLSMISLTMIVAAAQAASATPTTVPATPVVQIGIFSYGPDGATRGAAYETNLSSESFQYVAGCAIGGGNRPVPAEASDAWRLSGKVENLAAGEAVVQLEWQRIRADGIAVSAPGGSVQLTLHPGDRVPLDSVNRSATAQCPATTIGFEARYGPRSGPWRFRGAGQSGSSSGVSAGGSGGSAGAAAGGGVAAGTGAGAAGAVSGGVAANPQSKAVHMPKNQIPVAAEAQPIDVDLWLVRNAPGREESAVHQALSGVRGEAQFAFAPLSIETRGGTLNLQVTGSLRVTGDEAGARQLIFSTTRAVRFAPAAAGRDAPPVTKGRSVTTHAMPGPDDVLSFEMPALRVPNGAAAVPDQFSIRVRIR